MLRNSPTNRTMPRIDVQETPIERHHRYRSAHFRSRKRRPLVLLPRCTKPLIPHTCGSRMMKRWRALNGLLPSAGKPVLTLEWSTQARDDLAGIQPEIKQRPLQAATDLLDTITRDAELSAFAALAFRAGHGLGTRGYLAPLNILIHQVGKMTIKPLRVLHAKRQYP